MGGKVEEEGLWECPRCWWAEERKWRGERVLVSFLIRLSDSPCLYCLTKFLCGDHAWSRRRQFTFLSPFLSHEAVSVLSLPLSFFGTLPALHLLT